MSSTITAAFYRGDKTFAVETQAPAAPRVAVVVPAFETNQLLVFWTLQGWRR